MVQAAGTLPVAKDLSVAGDPMPCPVAKIAKIGGRDLWVKAPLVTFQDSPPSPTNLVTGRSVRVKKPSVINIERAYIVWNPRQPLQINNHARRPCRLGGSLVHLTSRI